MYKVAIIGLGFVGLSLASFLGSKGIKITGIDVDSKKLESIKNGISPFYEPELEQYLKRALNFGITFQTTITEKIFLNNFIFITVGTPSLPNGKINLQNIKTVVQTLAKKFSSQHKKPCIIIKSTTIPGTAIDIIRPLFEKEKIIESKNFNLLSNPEFLKEGSAMQDTANPHLIVIGGTSPSSTSHLVKFYKQIHRKDQKFIVTNNHTAELIKYSNNAFLAMKISFINSLANICQKIPHVNIDDIAQAIGLDPRIGSLFLKAGPGFGGSCFSKDLKALSFYSKSLGYEPILLNAIEEVNVSQRKLIIQTLRNSLKNIRNKKIGILGLSFKEDTNDIRESPSIKLIKSLLKLKSEIIVHDPKAIPNTKKIFKNKIQYGNKIDDVLKNADCVILMTPWNQYSKLKTKNFLKMKTPLVIDTRRILNLDEKLIQYVGLGIGN